MKQHGAVLALWAAICFTVTVFGKPELSSGKRLGTIAIFGTAMILPFAVCCLILWRAGVFEKFWFWTVEYAREYASVVPLSESPRFLWQGSRHALAKGFLLLPFAAAGGLLLWFDERLAGSRLWVFSFGLASVLSVFPDFYFRKHYFLLMLPGLALLAGTAVSSLCRCPEQKTAGQISTLAGLGLCVDGGDHHSDLCQHLVPGRPRSRPRAPLIRPIPFPKPKKSPLLSAPIPRRPRPWPCSGRNRNCIFFPGVIP